MSKLAIVSLILALFFFIPFASILAIILGVVAIRRISKNPGLKGKGIAVLAIVLGCLPFILLIMSTVFGFFAYWGGFDTNEFVNKIIPTWDCSLYSDAQLREICFFKKAKQKNDPEICNKMKYPLKCYQRLGITNYSVDVCYKEIQPSNCIYHLAIAKNNETLCNESVEWKEYCYWDLAVLRSDTHLCENIAIPSKYLTKQSCYAAILNASLCEEDIDKEACYSKVAIAKKDKLLCLKLSDDKRNSCVVNIAKDKLDETVCEYAIGSTIEDCYWTIVFKKKDVNICEKAKEKKPYCIATIKGAEFCKYTPDKPLCYEKVAIARGDKGLCRKAKNKELCRVYAQI